MGDDQAVVDHGDRVGQRVGLLQVLRRQQHRRALRRQQAHHVPDVVALARVEPGRGLVEEDDGGSADQAGGQVEAPSHAAGVGLRPAVAGLVEAELVQQLAGAGAGVRAGEVQQPGEQLEILPAGQLLVDRGVLAGQADRAADAVGVLHDVAAGDRGGARVGTQEGREDADGGGLARAVGAEDPEHGSLGDGQVDAVECCGRAVVLREALGVDGVVGHADHAGRRRWQVAVIALTGGAADDSGLLAHGGTMEPWTSRSWACSP